MSEPRPLSDTTSADAQIMPSSSMLQWVQHKLGIDRAVAFGSFSTIWGLLAGLVSLLLIASHFSQEVQGYYYTFNSLLALTLFVELGLGTVIQQFASHEWSRLSMDSHGRVTGDADALSRLASIAHFSFRWYAVAGALAAIGIGTAGLVFFSQRPSPGIAWTAPWLMLCVFSGIKLLVVPAWALLDGCNQMRITNGARFAIAVVTNLSGWTAILLGFGLWTAVALSAATVFGALTFFWRRYRDFFRSVSAPTSPGHISWRREVWPMQWKIALSWLSGYFIFSLFTPVMFHFDGPVVAGQVGITLSLTTTLLSVALSWVSTKAPAFGMLIARRDYAALDRLFLVSTRQAMAIGGFGSLIIWSGICGLNWIQHPLAVRFLPPLPVGLFLLATIMNLLVACMATYLRAHKQEPYLVPSILGGLCVGASTVILGSRYGVNGAAAGYCALATLFLAPEIAIFRHCRSVWHVDSHSDISVSEAS